LKTIVDSEGKSLQPTSQYQTPLMRDTFSLLNKSMTAALQLVLKDEKQHRPAVSLRHA